MNKEKLRLTLYVIRLHRPALCHSPAIAPTTMSQIHLTQISNFISWRRSKGNHRSGRRTRSVPDGNHEVKRKRQVGTF